MNDTGPPIDYRSHLQFQHAALAYAAAAAGNSWPLVVSCDPII
jgi:hypothetical protein